MASGRLLAPSPAAGAPADPPAIWARVLEVDTNTRAVTCDLANPVCVRDQLDGAGETDQLVRRAIRPFGCLSIDEKLPVCESTLLPKMAQSDSDNVRLLRAVIARHGWPGKTRFGEGAEFFVWMITVHAVAFPDFQGQALGRFEIAAAAGGADRSQLAYLRDRVAVESARANASRPRVTVSPGSGSLIRLKIAMG